MKIASRFIIAFFSNLVAFWVVNNFVSGVSIPSDFWSTTQVAAIFTFINFFLGPVFKLILGPIIFLTLGLGIILVNMILLYILDLYSATLTINGLLPLFYATLIIGLTNFLIHFAVKRVYK
ncbi:phage holin family protein [Candidatus Wolfebacteria bacterium]|nr:phage holin family protein [Candidatus Wolfebacteria bacterium]